VAVALASLTTAACNGTAEPRPCLNVMDPNDDPGGETRGEDPEGGDEGTETEGDGPGTAPRPCLSAPRQPDPEPPDDPAEPTEEEGDEKPS